MLPTIHINWQNKDILYWTTNQNSKVNAENKIIKAQSNVLGILKSMESISLIFILFYYDYSMLTKTWYKVQASSKITILNGYSNLQDLQSLILFWIRVCAIVAFLGYQEVVLLIFPEFSPLYRILSIVLSLPKFSTFFIILPPFL